MKRTEALEKFRHEIRRRGKAYSTEKTYLHWIGRYIDFLLQNRDKGPGDWLSFLADPQTTGEVAVSASTQRQALNALAKFYEWVLDRDLGKLDYTPGKKNVKVPDFLTMQEAHALFGQMRGVPQLQAQLMFGTGARVSECLSLRIKDLDFGNHTVTIRDGKGAKDRVVPMPRCLSSELQEQTEKAAYWWRVDREQGNPSPQVPDSLARKLGKQVEGFPWFWVFPASKLSKDPRSGIVRRHHLTDRGVAKAIKQAAQRAQLSKRVHPHVLRHSFATESLRNGLDIKSLATLMGHNSTKTTERYLHCLPDLAFCAVSPLDAGSPAIVPFVREEELARVSA